MEARDRRLVRAGERAHAKALRGEAGLHALAGCDVLVDERARLRDERYRIGVVLAAPTAYLILSVTIASLLFLAGLGAVSAQVGGAGVWNGAWRVALWGALAMGVTAGAGTLVGTVT